MSVPLASSHLLTDTGENDSAEAVCATRTLCELNPEPETNPLSRYCVRPNSGRIEPGHEVEVSGQSQAAPLPLFRALNKPGPR